MGGYGKDPDEFGRRRQDLQKQLISRTWQTAHLSPEMWQQPFFGPILSLGIAFQKEATQVQVHVCELLKQFSDINKERVWTPTSDQLKHLTARLGMRLHSADNHSGKKPNDYAAHRKLYDPEAYARAIGPFDQYNQGVFTSTFPEALSGFSTENASNLLGLVTQMIDLSLWNMPYWPAYMNKLLEQTRELRSRFFYIISTQLADQSVVQDGQKIQAVAKVIEDDELYRKDLIIPTYVAFVASKEAREDKRNDKTSGPTFTVSDLTQQAIEMISDAQSAQDEQMEDAGKQEPSSILQGESIFNQPVFLNVLDKTIGIMEKNGYCDLFFGYNGVPTWGIIKTIQKKSIHASGPLWNQLRAIANFRQLRFNDSDGRLAKLYELLGTKKSTDSYIKMCVTNPFDNLKQFYEGADNTKLKEAFIMFGILMNIQLDMIHPFWHEYLTQFAQDTDTYSHILSKSIPGFDKYMLHRPSSPRLNEEWLHGLDDLLPHVQTSSGVIAYSGNWKRWRGLLGGLRHGEIDIHQDRGRQPPQQPQGRVYSGTT